MDDTPIESVDYVYGVNVVQIGEARIARGKAKRERSACKHLDLTYDSQERRIWCDDCESTVDPFDVVVGLAEFVDGAIKKLQSREAALKEAESFALRSRAAKTIDKAWRSHSMAPCCPHCDEALLPEDIADRRLSSKNKQMERLRRQKLKGRE